MASIPTPSTLRTWDEAFAHPLPVVRKLETQLRSNIAENQNKLRSLVGASYRDLLGTAERIIDMDSQIQLVEGNLTSIGRRCDYRVVERRRENLGGLRRAGRRGEDGKLESMARVKVLKGALETVGRVVRKGGDALVAAKLLVLARLLLKSVAEGVDVSAVTNELRSKMVVLRKKLLAYVERSLVRTSGDRVSLANTLCAYAMVTSSAPKDVLRHFLQVRYEQLEAKSEEPSEAGVLEMLEIYGKTLLDTRELFPRRFAEALAQLSKAPLLHDPQIATVQELNLDIYQRWIPEDIRTFTPWVRHDQLTSSDAAEGLKSWVRQAQITLLQGIETCLQTQTHAKDVLSTRRTVLLKYLSVSSKIRNDQFSTAVDRIRDAFSTRLRELATTASDLFQFALNDLTNPKPVPEQTSVWSLASKPIDAAAGAHAFRTAILDHRLGRQGQVKHEHVALDRWLDQLNAFRGDVAEMRSSKWDDDVDFDLDDLEYEGDAALQDLLSKKDPAQIEAHLAETTAQSFQKAYHCIIEAEANGVDAVLLIRLLRSLNQARLSLSSHITNQPLPEASLIKVLHNSIAQQASSAPLQQLTASARKQTYTPTNTWDGTPPLPIQPSPATFRFLSALQRSMAALGEDLWSPAAVRVLKLHITKVLATDFGTIALPPASDVEAATDDDAGAKEAYIQRLFDVLYLSRVLSTSTSEDDSSPLEGMIRKLREKTGLGLDEVAWQRSLKSAREYWKRTGLLFGLLAVGG